MAEGLEFDFRVLDFDLLELGKEFEMMEVDWLLVGQERLGFGPSHSAQDLRLVLI